MRCTEPELWATVPDEDAPDDLIQNYLEHLDACKYHADLERRREEAVRLSFDAARSVAKDFRLTSSEQEEVGLIDTLERFSALRGGDEDVGPVKLRADGREVGTLDFKKHRKGKVKIGRSQPLQIFGRGGAGRELLLATYVPVAQRRPGSYLVSFNGRQSMRLEVRPTRGEKVLLKITCLVTSPAGEKRGLLAGLKFSEWFRPGLIAATAFILLAVIILPVILRRNNPPGGDSRPEVSEVVRVDESNTAPETGSILRPSPQPSDEPARDTNQNGRGTVIGEKRSRSSPPRRNRAEAGGGQKQIIPAPDEGFPTEDSNTSGTGQGVLRSGGMAAKTYDSLRDVRSIYVDEQEGGFRQAVRAAVIKRLGEIGFVTRVSREEADARLRLTWEGSNGVRFRLRAGERELLNFGDTFTDSTAEEANALARRFQGEVKRNLE